MESTHSPKGRMPRKDLRRPELISGLMNSQNSEGLTNQSAKTERVAISFNAQFSTRIKRHTKEMERWLVQRDKINLQKQSPKEHRHQAYSDKDFETTFLNTLKELKRNVDKN